MFLFVRTVAYATLFVGSLLIYFPARILAWTGIHHPATPRALQIAGVILGSCGAVLALWCVSAFVFIGKGTPAPFDPPRQLVVRGPYRWVRNPMYVGAGLVLTGAALFYLSLLLFVYGIIFLLVFHLVVVLYEEPALHRVFGPEYRAYCTRVGRWIPRLPRCFHYPAQPDSGRGH